jgi:hypothetical protein
MTLADLLPQATTITYTEAKTMALVFGQAAYEALRDAQAQRPDAHHRAAPVQLTNGQWMLCADLLTELRPGGLYADGFSLLPAELFAEVDVIPWDDAVALLPQAEPEVERIRARDAQGQFVADDPATPDVNEAWE